MIKNTASQKVGAQMVSATDGSAFTGSVVVDVTVDAGTQAPGSVGSAACAHEGKGYHTYAPAQAETNGDLIAFTFTGTGAVPQTVQVYTRAATPDVNVTAMAAGVITAAVIAADAITDAKVASDVTIASVTGAVGSVTGAVGSVTGAVGSVGAGGITAASFAADAITAAKLHADVTTELQSGLATAASITSLDTKIGTPAGASVSADLVVIDDFVDALESRLTAARAGYLDNLSAGAVALEASLQALITTIGASAAGVATAVWGAATRLLSAGTNIVLAKGVGVTGFNDLSAAQVNTEADTAIADAALATAANMATVAGYLDTEIGAIKAKTDLIPAAPAAVGDVPTATQNADALLARDLGSGSGAGTLDERTVRSSLRFNRNRFTIAGGVLTVYKENDTDVAFTAAITQTAGNPVSASDPT